MQVDLVCYLNELSTKAEYSLGIGIAKLFVETPKKAPELAQQLMTQARENWRCPNQL